MQFCVKCSLLPCVLREFWVWEEFISSYPLFDGDSRPLYVLLARLSSHTSHLRIHLPFQAQGQYDARLNRGRFLVVPFSSLQQWCLHPGSVADIRHLDNIFKGVSPSSPILVLKSSKNVTSTTQTCFRVDFQHRENLLLLFCPARFVSQELIWYLLSQLAWTNTGRTCSSYCLFSPPLVLELGLQSNPLDLLDPPLPSAKILLETCFFSNHDLTALTHGEVLSRLAGKLPKRVELVAKEAQYIGGKWLFVGKIEKCDGAGPLQD